MIRAGAEERFFRSSLAGLGELQQEQVRRITEKILEQGSGFRSITSSIVFVPVKKTGSDRIALGDKEVQCNFLCNYAQSEIHGAYVFAVTGQEEPSHFQGTEGIYQDILRTSYIQEAGEEVYRQILNAMEEAFPMGRRISGLLGPGYFGMDPKYAKELLELVKGEEIGIHLHPLGVMDPPKSLVGMYLVLSDWSKRFPMACKDCKGTAQGCIFCEKRGL